MRKQYVILMLLLAVAFGSCDRREIEIFTDGNEIYFEKFYINEVYPGVAQADSTVASFFFYPDGTKNIEAPLTLLLSGDTLKEDQKFQLRVIENETTANPDEYTIDPEYVFHANTVNKDSNDIRDVIRIKFHRSDRLESMPDGVTLVVEIVPNENLKLGQIERTRAKLILTTATAQPTWWNDEVTNNLLGDYSAKKYKLFLNEIDRKVEMGEELIREHPDRALQLTLEFKYWLLQQDPIILDEDEEPMEVAL